MHKIAVAAILMAGMTTAQQKARQVNDGLLKTGSKTGDEWISYGVNSVAVGPEGSGAFGPPPAATDGAAPPRRPGHLVLLTLDGKAPIPGVTPKE